MGSSDCERCLDCTHLAILRPAVRPRLLISAAAAERRILFFEVTATPAHRLIAGYAGVTALLNLFVLLPGEPGYSSAGGIVGSAAIQAAVIWWLWRGSPFAWLFALAFALLTIVSLVLMGAGTGVGVILLAALCVAQAGILLTRPVLAFVWSHRDTPAPAS
jgi:hypothetical protein